MTISPVNRSIGPNQVYSGQSNHTSQPNLLAVGRDALEKALEYHKEAQKSSLNQAEASLDGVKDNLKRAEESFDQAAQSNPRPQNIEASLAASYVELGDVLCELSLFSAAERNYKKAKEYISDEKNKVVVDRKLNSLPRFFKQNPGPKKDRLFPTTKLAPSDMIDTAHLAYCLQKENLSQDQKNDLVTLADKIIDIFTHRSKTMEIMREIVPLSKIPNKVLYGRLISETVNVLASPQYSIMSEVAAGLAVMIRNSPREAEINLKELLETLKKCLEKAKETGEMGRGCLLSLLQATSQLLDAIVQSSIRTNVRIEISRENLKNPLMRILSEFIRELKEPELTYQANYAYQALMNIPNDESHLHQIWRHIYNIGGSAVLIASGITSQDISKFVDALDRLKPESDSLLHCYEKSRISLNKMRRSFKGERSANYNELYIELKTIDFLLDGNQLDQFEYVVRKSGYCKDKFYLQALCQRLERIATTIPENEIAKKAIEFLGDLVHWNNSKDVVQSVANALKRLEKQSRLKNYITDIRRNLRLQDPTASYDKVIHIWDPIWQKIPNKGLLSDVKQTLESDEPHIDCLQKDILTDAAKIMLKKRYVKRTAYIGIDDNSSHVNLRKTIRTFLNSEDKKILLLLGEAGSGKTVFNQFLAQFLWKKNHNPAADNPWIPLYIFLPSRKESHHNLIPEYLKGKGFSAQYPHLNAWRDKRFLFILDGYDGVMDPQRTIYADGTLGIWIDSKYKSKIIFTSRPLNQEGYQERFHPYGEEQLLQEYKLSPVNIQKYTKKYLVQHGSVSETQDYDDAFRNTPDLQRLLKNPLLLEQTLEIWPKARDKKVKLYDKLIDRWYKHVYSSLERASPVASTKLERYDDFKMHAIEFNKALAVAMYQAEYPADQDEDQPDEDEDYPEAINLPSRYAAFLRNTLQLLNAPLIYNYEEGEYQFIDKSLRDYFVARALWEPEPEPKPRRWKRNEKEEVKQLNLLKLDQELNQNLLVLDFLVERVQQAPDLKERLSSLLSSQDSSQELAAQNAQAILNLARPEVLNDLVSNPSNSSGSNNALTLSRMDVPSIAQRRSSV
ncbi:NACHT domain-containing NTPase [Mycoavidus sp. SF9855]|uniref:NACHT domain-containing protein n=1 Tax=Mycoavidus sp. SF9855 TaxID=2968475 RepID=UPI00211CBE5B|nr:NACHT domain-containing protein [Mycoavidus sp. SF9855]UUM22245.1 NACHT domain-containing protein [Mycoavidus sp. SF9855]